MRLVPRSPSLKLTPSICSTNGGRSVVGGYRGKPKGNHSTARPSLPAIAVNVPHSWTVRSGTVRGSSVVQPAVQPASEKSNSPNANQRGSHDLTPPCMRDFPFAGFIVEAFLRGRRREVRRLSGGRSWRPGSEREEDRSLLPPSPFGRARGERCQ